MQRLSRLIGLMWLLNAAACGTPSLDVGSKFIKSQVIGAQGGIINVNTADSATVAGMKIVVPPNALSADTRLTIMYGTALSLADAHSAGISVDLGPNGTHFNQPVAVTLPYALPVGAQAGQLVVDARESSGAQYRILHSYVTTSGGFVTFFVQSFTTFQPDAIDDNDGGCAEGLTSCAIPDGGTDVACVDTATDSQNCGSCGNQCTGTTCNAGICAVSSTCDGGTEQVDVFQGASYVDALSRPADSTSIKVYLDGPPPDVTGDGGAGVAILPTNPNGMANWTYDATANAIDVNSDNLTLGAADALYVEYTATDCTIVDGGGGCSQGLTSCILPDGGSDANCVNEQTDNQNCGGCGIQCVGGNCVNGGCVDAGSACGGEQVDEFQGASYVDTLSQLADSTSIAVYLDGPPPDVANNQVPGLLLAPTNPNSTSNWTYDATANAVDINSANVSLSSGDSVFVEYTSICH